VAVCNQITLLILYYDITVSNKYELLSDTSNISVGQEKIPVVVGGVVSQVNITCKNPVRVSDFKVKNRNSMHVMKRNTDGAITDVKKSEKKKDHKVVSIGGLASWLSDILKPNFEVV
jgi:hypothetical protein